MKEFITKQNLATEYYIPENCYITELSNSSDDPDISIARARVAPNETTRWHYLTDTVERYYILEGEGRVEIGDLEPQIVMPGDIAVIPAQCRQRITNIGTQDLIFLAICTPRFSMDVYRDIEDTEAQKV